jgi:hypothetical protein
MISAMLTCVYLGNVVAVELRILHSSVIWGQWGNWIDAKRLCEDGLHVRQPEQDQCFSVYTLTARFVN